jgi:hypothetical protein
MEALADHGLDAGEQADSIDRYVWNIARIFDRAIARVTIAGRAIWQRESSNSSV